MVFMARDPESAAGNFILKAKCVWDEPTFCCEDEGECTVELHAGQFRFLVQFEENNVLGFDAETSLKQEIKKVTL